MRLFTLLFALLPAGFAYSQGLSGVVNHYAAVALFDTCTGRLAVSDTAGFRPGQRAILMHMQGALMNTPNNSNFGQINDLRQTGRFEKVQITAVDAGSIFIINQPVYGVFPDQKAQLITFPKFSDQIVSDTIKALPWNGQIGGVIALEIEDTLRLDAPIWADGAGFRGGISYVASSNNCTWALSETDFVYNAGNWRGGRKGEGVAGQLSTLGRGAPATGGGGGNDHNSGGGGGGNTSAGGRGGENDEPSTFGCDGYYPGQGAWPVTSGNQRLFLGGGGGSGHANNLLNSDGGNGGGILIIKAGYVTGAQPFLTARGLVGEQSAGDGSGGGGAGGTIWLDLAHTAPNLTLDVTGGGGGNAHNGNADRCFGPGGGGGGGRIVANAIGGTTATSGGAAGLTVNSANGCNNTSNGAEAGGTGTLQALFPMVSGTQTISITDILLHPESLIVCEGEAAVFEVQLAAPSPFLTWQVNDGTGWVDIPNSASLNYTVWPASSAQNGAQYRFVSRRTGCFEVVSEAALLTVVSAPEAQFSFADIAPQTFQFSPFDLSQAEGWNWDFGDGQFSTETAPTHTYLTAGQFDVTLTVWNACDTVTTTQTISFVLPPIAAFMAPVFAEGCESVAVQFENQSFGATSFEWTFSGGNPVISNLENPIITYFNSGSYDAVLIASNAAGQDTLTRQLQIEIFDFPQADFEALVNGFTVTLTNNSTVNAVFTWDFGDGSPISSEISPTHTYAQSGEYVVTLIAQNACGASIFQQTIEIMVSAADDPVNFDAVFRVFPNPTSGELILDASGPGALPERVECVDMNGKVHLVLDHPASVMTLDLSRFPSGVYLIRLMTHDGVGRRYVIKSR